MGWTAEPRWFQCQAPTSLHTVAADGKDIQSTASIQFLYNKILFYIIFLLLAVNLIPPYIESTYRMANLIILEKLAYSVPSHIGLGPLSDKILQLKFCKLLLQWHTEKHFTKYE